MLFSFFHSLFLLILLLYLSINLCSANSGENPDIVLLKFKIYFPEIKDNQFQPKDYYNSIHSSKIYLKLETGNTTILHEKQIINTFLKLNKIDFFLSDHFFSNDEKNNRICQYTNILSNTYKKLSTKDKIIVSGEKNCIHASELFRVYSDFSLLNYKLLNISFIHAINYNEDDNNYHMNCGYIGLQNFESEIIFNTNFFSQLKSNFKNMDYSWSIKFNSFNNNNEEYNGIFMLGILPYEKKIKNDEYVSEYSEVHYGNIEWKFRVDNIYIDDNIFKLNENKTIQVNIKLTIDIEGFEIPLNFYNKLKEIFFDKYLNEKICQEIKIKNNINIIYCDNNKFNENDTNNFPEINFFNYNFGFNFSFNGDELFHFTDNKYFFRMIIDSNNNNNFKFGRFFMKKYQTFFDPNSKRVFFDKTTNKKYLKNSKNSIGNILFSAIKYFFLITLVITFLIIGIIIGRKCSNYNRKRLVNELEDDNYFYGNRDKINQKNKEKLIEMKQHT